MTVFLNGLGELGQPLSIAAVLLRIGVAVLIGAIIGIDREIKNRPAGMRTHVLVCVGAALVSMLECQAVADAVALDNAAIGVSVGRITTSVVSGIGFLGAGTIFMSDHKISGLTTAASLWCTACIGLAVGFGYIMMALAVGAIVLAILKLMQRVVHVNTLKRLEVQFIHRTQTLAFLNEYFMNLGVTVLNVDFHAESRPEGNLYTNLYTLTMPAKTSYVDIIGTLSEYPNIRTVRTRNL